MHDALQTVMKPSL